MTTFPLQFNFIINSFDTIEKMIYHLFLLSSALAVPVFVCRCDVVELSVISVS